MTAPWSSSRAVVRAVLRASLRRVRQAQHPLDGLPAARHASWRFDVQDRAADDRIGAARPAEHEPVARAGRDRFRQPQDRDRRSIRQVDGVSAASADRCIDGGRAQMEAGLQPVGQLRSKPDEQARTGHDGRVVGQHQATVEVGRLDPGQVQGGPARAGGLDGDAVDLHLPHSDDLIAWDDPQRRGRDRAGRPAACR